MNEIIQMTNPDNGNNQYPQTVLSAITDDAGNTLQNLIEHAPIARVGIPYQGNAYRDADRLGGELPSYYAKNSDLSKFFTNNGNSNITNIDNIAYDSVLSGYFDISGVMTGWGLCITTNARGGIILTQTLIGVNGVIKMRIKSSSGWGTWTS